MSVCMTSTGCCCHVLMKIDISVQIFEEFSNIKHHDRRSSGTQVVLCGRTDGHDKANSHFSQFFEST